ncbi:MAG: aminotransferase class I/II-fold pyridoxal phosphate-dependent enzyme [Clostridiales bacterium]|jgi:arginine decarboxylase|nr:aminotransferase class I/II-fold pyridoxal phosphate-dependent enzyme [Eubacteriales bacterium]MDH7566111.1 aminotransferase class I/II-fold pyridoxal phosphate-dependent enzyme [Clostridiales bacterium]
MSNWNVPLYNAVMRYSNSAPVAFHMPGHKLGKGIPEELLKNPALLDVTEIPGTDNLHFPEGPIKEAQDLAAQVFFADKTYFLVNGSTGGIHSMMMAVCRPGDKLIVGRDCHKSVIGGMMLGGIKPVYVKPEYESDFGVPSVISPEKLEEALRQNPDAAGVLITRPNYYGICSDIEEIARIVHAHGKILMVDEAHGAHLGFHHRLPVCAMQAGADICVQSAHKTLPAFTQGAYLHVKSPRVDVDRLEFYLRTLQTSSPSYVLMAFLDIAREIMAQRGKELMERLLGHIDWFKAAVEEDGRMDFLDAVTAGRGRLDNTRLVVHMKRAKVTGFETERLLREHFNIQVEMSDYYNVVCIATTADRREDFEKLRRALGEVCRRSEDNPPLDRMGFMGWDIPEIKIELKDIMKYKGVKVKLCDSVGKTSLEMVTPYPPGIPALCPGETISARTVEHIKRIADLGGIVNGLSSQREIRVVE